MTGLLLWAVMFSGAGHILIWLDHGTHCTATDHGTPSADHVTIPHGVSRNDPGLQKIEIIMSRGTLRHCPWCHNYWHQLAVNISKEQYTNIDQLWWNTTIPLPNNSILFAGALNIWQLSTSTASVSQRFKSDLLALQNKTHLNLISRVNISH